MHIALQLAPKCIAKLSEVEAYLSSLGVSEDDSDLFQEEDGLGYSIDHSAESQNFRLKWGIGFAPPEGHLPDEDEPCVMTYVTLMEKVEDKEQTLLDITYFPLEREKPWQIEHSTMDPKRFAELSKLEQLEHFVYGHEADDAQAFVIISVMAKIFNNQRSSTPPSTN
ncbi:MAG: hypothetical protein PHS79_00580 [Patescibacteria group bacterium]|nr:hypothetical protein [Patescibacteria group bacterium]